MPSYQQASKTTNTERSIDSNKDADKQKTTTTTTNVNKSSSILSSNNQRSRNNDKDNKNPSQNQSSQRAQVNKSSNVASSVTSAASTGPGAKIDSDLVNVANENRVILNVGGIRHETYKVSLIIIVKSSSGVHLKHLGLHCSDRLIICKKNNTLMN